VYWNYRMFLLHVDSKYIDVLERSLYNGVLSGVGLDGKTFFYPNPLECDMEYHFNQGGSLTREPWFDCSCCPSNLCRFMPSVPGYIYAQTADKLYVNLFIQSATELNVAGSAVAINQETDYPWNGDVKLEVSPEAEQEFAVCIRIPGWAQNNPVPSDLYRYENTDQLPIGLTVNGESVEFVNESGYAVLTRKWKKGDVIEYSVPMEIRKVKANELVEADKGLVALERGPIVYCVEGADNADIEKIGVSPETAFDNSFNSDLLGGVEVVTASDGKGKSFTAIPYYTWDNRGANKMKVWLTEE